MKKQMNEICKGIGVAVIAVIAILIIIRTLSWQQSIIKRVMITREGLNNNNNSDDDIDQTEREFWENQMFDAKMEHYEEEEINYRNKAKEYQEKANEYKHIANKYQERFEQRFRRWHLPVNGLNKKQLKDLANIKTHYKDERNNYKKQAKEYQEKADKYQKKAKVYKRLYSRFWSSEMGLPEPPPSLDEEKAAGKHILLVRYSDMRLYRHRRHAYREGDAVEVKLDWTRTYVPGRVDRVKAGGIYDVQLNNGGEVEKNIKADQIRGL